MALPVVSVKPDIVIDTKNSIGVVVHSIRRSGRTRQRKPYTLPSSAYTLDAYVDDLGQYGYGGKAPISLSATAMSLYNLTNPTGGGIGLTTSYNQAWARFIARLQNEVRGDTDAMNASLGETFAEGHQALGMIVKRAGQLRLFARHLRRLELGRVRADLVEMTGRRDVRLPGNLRKNAKTFADNFLEFHFGWAPLLSDIHGAASVLMNGVPPVHVSAKGKSVDVIVNSHTVTPGPYGKTAVETRYGLATTTTRLSAYVKVSNPNVWLLNQLGLINPVTIAWNLVPFSFVVDWFVNISNVLNGYSDLMGLSLERTSRTDFRRINETRTYVSDYISPGPRGYSMRGTSVSMLRGATIGSGPQLEVKAFKGLSLVRGVTAISLLLQMLR